jgi:predicted HicB family RNase H-like nuclease
MAKISKNCCVRLPPELHRKAKLKAYEKGVTIQKWVITLIYDELFPDGTLDAETLESFPSAED